MQKLTLCSFIEGAVRTPHNYWPHYGHKSLIRNRTGHNSWWSEMQQKNDFKWLSLFSDKLWGVWQSQGFGHEDNGTKRQSNASLYFDKSERFICMYWNIITHDQEPYLEEFMPSTIVNAYYSPLTHRISTIVNVIVRLSDTEGFQWYRPAFFSHRSYPQVTQHQWIMVLLGILLATKWRTTLERTVS